MKDILTAPFLTEMRKTAANMYRCRIAERTQIQVPGLNGRVEEPVKSQKTT